MSDSPEKYLELIHAKVDGEATDQELSALRDYLALHPEMKNVQAELVKLTDILGQVGELETPADLHGSILATLPPRRLVAEIGQRNSRSRFRIPLIRYGYALAAGLLVGAALTGIAFKSLSPVEKSDIYGTLAVRENAPRYVVVEQRNLDSPELAGSVELRRSGSNAMIIFDLHGQQAVEVELGFDGSQAGLVSFDQQPGAIRSVEAKKGTISFQSEGKQHSTVLLTNEKNGQLTLDLRFYIAGKLIRHDALAGRFPGESPK